MGFWLTAEEVTDDEIAHLELEIENKKLNLVRKRVIWKIICFQLGSSVNKRSRQVSVNESKNYLNTYV